MENFSKGSYIPYSLPSTLANAESIPEVVVAPTVSDPPGSGAPHGKELPNSGVDSERVTLFSRGVQNKKVLQIIILFLATHVKRFSQHVQN